MRRISRRELIAGVAGAGSVSLAGCPACAWSVRVWDDYLRVSVPRFREVDGGYRGELRLLHRGPDNWDWGEHQRETFYTHYEDVRAVGYGPGGDEVLEVPVGDFDPGTTERASFETEEFPMVVTAIPGEVSFDTECPHADVGAHVGVYAGWYGTADPPEWETAEHHSDPRRDLETRLRRHGAGHRWVPFEGVDAREDERLPTEEFQYAKCIQRRLEGPSPDGPPDLAALPEADEWLTRREEVGFTVYADEMLAPRNRMRQDAVDVPDAVEEIVRTTDWEGMDGARRVKRSVSREEWKRLVGVLEGADGPTYPACDGDGVFCSDSWEYGTRGQCRRGRILGHYRFDPDRVLEDTEGWRRNSLVRTWYRWDGVL